MKREIFSFFQLQRSKSPKVRSRLQQHSSDEKKERAASGYQQELEPTQRNNTACLYINYVCHQQQQAVVSVSTADAIKFITVPDIKRGEDRGVVLSLELWISTGVEKLAGDEQLPGRMAPISLPDRVSHFGVRTAGTFTVCPDHHALALRLPLPLRRIALTTVTCY